MAVQLLRVVFVLLGARLFGRFLSGFVQGYAEPAPPRPGVDMVRDHVCNTFLPRERALIATVGGREAHFCSAACRDRALALAAP